MEDLFYIEELLGKIYGSHNREKDDTTSVKIGTKMRKRDAL